MCNMSEYGKRKDMRSEVYNIDCMEYMRTLPDKTFQLAIADPPYGINAPNMKMGENKGYVSTATKCKKGRLNSGGGKLKNRVLNQSDCSWDCEPPKQEFSMNYSAYARTSSSGEATTSNCHRRAASSVGTKSSRGKTFHKSNWHGHRSTCQPRCFAKVHAAEVFPP